MFGFLGYGSRVGVGMSHIVARVQVSTDNGANWSQLFEQVDQSEDNFSEHVIDLGPYVGKTIRVRFSSGYDFSGQGIGFSASNGWYVDDIAFSNVHAVGEYVVSAVMPGSTFNFTPSAEGLYELDAQPQYAGQYLTDGFGPKKRVTSAKPTPAAPPLPVITSQPAVDNVVRQGGQVTLLVGATGPQPLSYAWSFNGAALSDGSDTSGSHEALLTLRNVQTSQAGTYTVRVSIGELGISPAPSTIIVEPNAPAADPTAP